MVENRRRNDRSTGSGNIDKIKLTKINTRKYKSKKLTTAIFLGWFVLMITAGTAMADSGITRIRLHITDEVKAGELSWPKEVIAPENGVYEVADVEEIEMEEEDYQPGDYIRFRVTLAPAKSGRYFYEDRDNRTYEFTADYGQAEALDSQVDEDGNLVIRVKYGPAIYKLETPEHVRFSDANIRTVMWDEVANASGYVVELMDGGQMVKQISVGRALSCVLGAEGTEDGGHYYARVKAVPVGTSQKRYLYESDYGFTDTMIDGTALHIPGEWVQGNDGWRYRLPDNRYYRGGWLEIDGSQYYFDQETGLMQTDGIGPALGM